MGVDVGTKLLGGGVGREDALLSTLIRKEKTGFKVSNNPYHCISVTFG